MLIFLLSSMCQKLLIDSRLNHRNEAKLELFKNKFSIWFTIQKTKIEISQIF